MATTSKDHSAKTQTPSGLTRRSFLKGVGVAAVAAEGLLAPALAAAEAQANSAAGPVSGPAKITLHVNGQDRPVTVEPRTTLLSALRDHMEPGITGPKLVCNAATCGACTVIMDGKPVYGCSVLAIDAVGRQITTVEGLGTPEHPNAVQAAFVDEDAMMCGFCTSGFVTAISALLENNPNPTPDEVRHACAGNFCRCGTYPHVFQAALLAAKAGPRS
jgi:xanthine dehydrogenase YagT iron-sulfur-binding subunit